MAQSALETTRGEKSVCWNLGGIKATAAELHTYYPTREVLSRARADQAIAASMPSASCKLAPDDDGGGLAHVIFEPDHPMCRFRAYETLADSARDYLGLLVRRYPAAIQRARGGDAGGFVVELRRGGYFTGSLVDYERDVGEIFDELREPCLFVAAELRDALARLGFDDVPAFQRAAGLKDDDVVGPKTRAAIRARLGSE